MEFSPEETGYFVVMGEGGFTFGFSLYFGTDGFNMLLGLVQGEEYGIEQDYFLPCQDCITMLLDYCLEPEEREAIRVLLWTGIS